MKSIRSLAVVPALLAMPSIAHAQDADYETRPDVAREYTEATVADMDLSKVIRQMWIPIID